MIFIGVFTLISMLGLLFFAGAIYDAENKYRIDAFFFAKNLRSDQRLDTPVSAENIPNSFLRDILIARFLNEYFYVIPDADNARMRMNLKNTDEKHTPTLLQIMCEKRVRDDWLAYVAPQILELSKEKSLRHVQMGEISESESGYLVVQYKLLTWSKPNDVMALPTEEIGQLYMRVTKRDISTWNDNDTLNRLQKGYDPTVALRFNIYDVKRE